MKRFALCLLAATALCGGTAIAQEINYTTADVIKFPRTIYAGEVAGVATNSRGHIFVYQRAGNPWIAMGASRIFTHGGDQLLQFDQNGNYVREIGKGNYAFTVANSVRVDRQDNVWAVDRTAGMVIKFSPQGRILMTLGRKPESINITIAGGGAGRGAAPAAEGAAAARGAAAPAPAGRGGRGGPPGAGSQADTFSGSSDVAWDAQGNIFVSDGWGANNRVAKFTPDGVFVKSFGQTGSDNQSLNSPRSLAVDAVGNVYVADHDNNRVQVLDNNLNYLRSITGVGAPWAVCISPGATQYLYVSNSNPMDNLDTAGEIYKLQLNGTVVGRFGKAGKAPGEFATVNQMDCRQANTLYTAEAGGWRVQKVTLK
jgi:sugar lactone lactonase YvrE